MIITVIADEVKVTRDVRGMGVSVELDVGLEELVNTLVEEVGATDVLELLDVDDIKEFMEETR